MALVTRRLRLVQATLRESWLRTAARSTTGSAGCLLALNRGFTPSSTQPQRGFFSSTQLQSGFTPSSTQPQRGFFGSTQLQSGFSPASTLQLQRSFSTSTQPLRSDNKVTVNFINRDGEKMTVKGSPGDSLLDIVIEQDLDFDGFGACEGTLACSTCHLIFDEEIYKQLGPVTDEEMDMLDLAYGLTDTSRLGCQICLTKSLEGMVARVPESVADIRQSGDGSS